jgi:hypothetical protein
MLLSVISLYSHGQLVDKGALIYSNPLSDKDSLKGWTMEGPGETSFNDGWMQMYSPVEKGHHVLWCPPEFPANFVAEWEVQNLHPEAGLCIVFFSAKGVKGEDIFSPTLPRRDGKFKDYINGAISNYHISYYANAKNERGRETANLRKNPGFHKVQKGEAGIPIDSKANHKILLSKKDGHILMYVDARKIIDWQDETDALSGGKIGFRQMKWTRFAYRNLKVWNVISK